MTSEEQGDTPETTVGLMQPWACATWRGLSAFMTLAALLWNVDFLEWFGFAFVQEQYYAFVMAPFFCLSA
jgi:hypothetical protein